MKYKNTRTGVVIDSPTLVSGGNWVEYSPKQGKVETAEEIEVKVEDEVEDELEDEGEFDGLTKNQIIQELKSLGKDFNPRDKKEVLYSIMMED